MYLLKKNKIIHLILASIIPFLITNALGYGVTILAGFGLIAVMFGHI